MGILFKNMFKQSNHTSNNSIYEKIVMKDKTLSLTDLIENVRENLPKWHEDDYINKEITEYIRIATEGDLRFKATVKKEIENYLVQTQKQINEETIDAIIKQYHINYYENLFGDYDINNEREKEIYNYFEKYRISIDSQIEKKYKRLSQIIYQELYGLSVIDELADDIHNINGIWTNELNDIRIQYKGLKRKVKKLSFEDEKVYKNAIANATSYDAPGDIGTDNPKLFCSRRNGSRVTLITEPLSDIPLINIRNFNDNITNQEDIKREGTHNDLIIKLNEKLIKGRVNFTIIGPMGSGKTTYLRSLMAYYDDNLGILTIEPSDELRIKTYYPTKDVRKHIYTKDFTASDMLELSFREDRDIIMQGEIRTPEEAYLGVYVKQRVARGSGDTYHAGGFKEYMITMRNLLMQTGLYKDAELATMDLAYSNDIIYQLLYDSKTGRRYVNKISEIYILDKDNMKYEERVIIEYNRDIKDWIVRNEISNQLLERMRESGYFTSEDEKELKYMLKNNTKRK